MLVPDTNVCPSFPCVAAKKIFCALIVTHGRFIYRWIIGKTDTQQNLKSRVGCNFHPTGGHVIFA